MKIAYDTGLTIRGFDTNELPQITVEELPEAGSVSTAVVTREDIQYTETTTTGATNNCRLHVAMPLRTSKYMFRSITPNICNVDATGHVRRIINGTGIVSVDAERGGVRFVRNLTQATTVVKGSDGVFLAGSLGKHIYDSVAAMISGKSPGATSQAVLSSSSGGWSAPDHVRNSNLFTGALDLTAISVYTEAQGNNKFSIVLISQDHVIGGHAGTWPGKKVVFKNSANNYEVRTVVAQYLVAKNTGEDYVGVLDSSINTITPMTLMPAGWESYLPNFNSDVNVLPVLNKGWTAGDYIRILLNSYGADRSATKNFIYLSTGAGIFSSWTSAVIGGDSNGPVFVPVNGSPVLLHCMNYTIGGAHYSYYRTNIQDQMTALSLDYGKPNRTLGSANLSGFTAY